NAFPSPPAAAARSALSGSSDRPVSVLRAATSSGRFLSPGMDIRCHAGPSSISFGAALPGPFLRSCAYLRQRQAAILVAIGAIEQSINIGVNLIARHTAVLVLVQPSEHALLAPLDALLEPGIDLGRGHGTVLVIVEPKEPLDRLGLQLI